MILDRVPPITLGTNQRDTFPDYVLGEAHGAHGLVSGAAHLARMLPDGKVLGIEKDHRPVRFALEDFFHEG